MKILFYATQSDWAAEKLQRVLEGLVPRDQLEICRTFSRLSDKLYKPSNNLDIAVLTAVTDEELSKILSLRDLFSDIRIVLILPDSKSATISKAHTLGPRFLTYLDSDVEEVKSVLGKMLESQHSKKIQIPQPNLPIENAKTGKSSWGVVK
jgi:hypothetical protein